MEDRQETETATVMMEKVLTALSAVPNMPGPAQVLIVTAIGLMKGRSIVQSELNGALAINLSEMEHLGIILKDGPSAQQRDDYRDFVRHAEMAT